MTRESTVNKLIEMRLSAMAEAFRDQCASPEVYRDLSFEDRLGFLVDKEWEERRSKKLQRLIRSANLRYPNACMEDIEYHSDRKLDKSQLLRLSSCRYILEAHHIILKGATGERVIIVTGCINALVSRVSGTLIKNNSCIA